ncbi:MAG: hypothetical protein Q8T03_01255 [Bacteroidota bacterium]|nr:hypothetical protein [Bacteroidota bacterium]
MRKVIIGLLAGFIMLAVQMIVMKIFLYSFPSIQVEYENTNIFRSWSDPIMLIVFIEPFILGLILAWLWDFTKSKIRGVTLTNKGIYFGYYYWLITIPGMLMAYGSFQLSVTIVVSWSTTLFFQAICSGIFFSKLLK